jgi:adenylylsulfate kinase-like enzyme
MTDVVWITGRPASGKTTLGRAIVEALRGRERRATLVDSDEVRSFVTPAPRYDSEERALLYRAIAYVARRLAEESIVPVVAATAHEPALRAAARAICRGMILVHADCPLEVCERRDPKGLYRAARAAPSGTMPGVHVAWTPPLDADVTIDTSTAYDERALAPLLARLP